MKSSAYQRRFIQIGLLVLVYALALFLSAGRLSWLEGWYYLLIYMAFIGANAVLLLPKNRELIEERSRGGAGVKGWDRHLGFWMALFGLSVFIIAGLDERWTWSNDFPVAVQAIGAVGILIGDGIFGWAMASNPFFSTLVRIQSERGHHVAEGGPYRFVRHPGYAGMIFSTLCTPMLLDSPWAWIAAVLLCTVIVIRTALEDRTLRIELAGYSAYAGRVRFRLLPGVW